MAASQDWQMIFVDLVVYDAVPQEVIWHHLRSRGVSGKYAKVDKDMYANYKLHNICSYQYRRDTRNID